MMMMMMMMSIYTFLVSPHSNCWDMYRVPVSPMLERLHFLCVVFVCLCIVGYIFD